MLDQSTTLPLLQQELTESLNRVITSIKGTEKHHDFNEELALLNTCIEKLCTWPEPYFYRAIINGIQGNSASALKDIDLCIKYAPYLIEPYEYAISICLENNDLKGAEWYAKKRSVVNPDNADFALQLGSILLRQDQFTEAQKCYDKALNTSRSPDQERMLEYGTITYPRLLHDYRQLNFLINNGVLGIEYAGLLPLFESMLPERKAKTMGLSSWSDVLDEQIDSQTIMLLTSYYRRCLWLEPINYKGDYTLNSNLNVSSIQSSFFEGHYNKVVIDNFLNPESIALLSRYCNYSTIWHNDSQKGRNYLGAYQNSGIWVSLIDKIDRDIKHSFPEIFRDLQLSQIWAYRNVAGSKNIGIHADFSKVNVNIWLTPTECNLDSETGGLLVWNKKAPAEWDFDKYNSDEKEIVAFLEDTQPENIRYKYNRAVIFDSKLFHSSNTINFLDSFEGNRVNLTLLYD